MNINVISASAAINTNVNTSGAPSKTFLFIQQYFTVWRKTGLKNKNVGPIPVMICGMYLISTLVTHIHSYPHKYTCVVAP